MATSVATPGTSAIAVTPIGSGRLALILQEALTAITRLRTGQANVTDPAAFRAQMIQLLRNAEQDGAAAGYDPADVRLAIFATVALLDESVLNTRQPALADWARRPLQEELFGGHMAGEWFFQYIDQLLARPETPALIDLLEVFHLCLLMGFRGRYGSGDASAVHVIASRIGQPVSRYRGAPELVPDWRPPNDAVAGRDPWIRRLTIGLALAAVITVVIFGVAMMSLRGASATVAALAPPPTRGTTP